MIAAREVRYLARVGAWSYLTDVVAMLPSVDPALLADDTGATPCTCGRCLHGPGRGRRGCDHGAFKVYAAAERMALASLARAEGADLHIVADALHHGVTEGREVRRVLLDRGHPIPGRGRWLRTSQEALQGCSHDLPGEGRAITPGREFEAWEPVAA